MEGEEVILREEAISKLQRRLPPFPLNVIEQLYKIRVARLAGLKKAKLDQSLRWIIEGKLRMEETFPILHLSGTGKSSFAKKRRAKRLGSDCHRCVQWTCSGHCRSVGMPSTNQEDKIQFVKHGLSRENLVGGHISHETRPSGDVQRAILDLWEQFQTEWQRIGRLVLEDPVVQSTRELVKKRDPAP